MGDGHTLFIDIYYMPTLYLCFHGLPHFTMLYVRIIVIYVLDVKQLVEK